MWGRAYTSATMSLLNLTAQQLRKAANLKDQIAALEKQLSAITGTQAAPVQAAKPAKKGMSAAGRAKIAAAQKLRWAKVKAAKTKPAVKAVVKAVAKPAAKPVQKPAKKKFVMSAAAKAILSAKAKARWAAKKAGEKK
jgi:hypothetical protein